MGRVPWEKETIMLGQGIKIMSAFVRICLGENSLEN